MGTKFGPDGASDIAVANGYIYTTGAFYRLAEFDPAGAGLNQLLAMGYSADAYILKLKECIEFSEDNAILMTGPDSACMGATYTFSVPKIDGVVAYEWVLPAEWAGASDSAGINATIGGAGTIKVILKSLCDSTTVEMNVEMYMPSVIITIDEFLLSTTNQSDYTSWQWYLNGNKIEGATAPTYTVQANGLYSVIVTGGNNCLDSATYTVTNYTSVPSVSRIADQVHIYPNPAREFVRIEAPVPVSVRIMSVDGRVLQSEPMEGKTKVILMSGYTPGMYLLYIADQEGELLKIEKLIMVK
jgi:hypothetical protein